MNHESRMDDARRTMVERQLIPRGIDSPKVLTAMREIRRHEYVPAERAGQAYDDGPLPIGSGQTISQPYIVAWMTQLLRIGANDKVLEIGTGCAYQTAVLAKVARHVYSMERVERLARQATANLQRAGIKNVTLKVGDGFEGWAEHGPFQGIVVTAAPSGVPESLTEQLDVGASLVVPVGPRYQQEMLRVTRKSDGKLTEESLGAVRFVPMLSGKQL